MRASIAFVSVDWLAGLRGESTANLSPSSSSLASSASEGDSSGVLWDGLDVVDLVSLADLGRSLFCARHVQP